MPQYTLVDLTIKQDYSVKELESLLPGSQSLVSELLLGISSDLEKSAVSAFQSTVPVRTLQLRNSMILSKSKNFKYTQGFKVYVSTAKHTNTEGRRKPTGAELAQILDEGISEKNGAPLMRRKNAVPAFNKLTSIVAPSRGEPTKGWSDLALQGFEKAIDGI
jgi:hypothetical protein